MVAVSSLLYGAKGILVKMGYRLGMDTVTVLALRNLLALPFFLAGLWWSGRGKAPLTGADGLRIAALGFLGYYFASLTDFLGLQHIGAGLERMILFTYPSMVMIGSVVFLGHRPGWRPVGAMLLAYAGLALGFAAEVRLGSGGRLFWGSALVFVSAISYAIYTTGSGEMIRRLGGSRVTSWALMASALMVLTHHFLAHGPLSLLGVSAEGWRLGAVLAVFGTVVPSYLLGWGVQRLGAAPASVIGMIGPVATLILANFLLGEKATVLQGAGMALTLAGGLLTSLLERRSPKA